jgi:D-glycero-alpha-D-manno-heptose-7-phosphate kinase
MNQLVISKTPFRISFVGGGTDLRSFYSIQPGQVISSSINQYIYVIVKKQSSIHDFKYRINWSKVEFKNNIEDIEHPIVREALKLLDIDFPCEISTFADIPAQSGLGSSSAFAVGLLNALYELKGETKTRYEIANEAAKIEVDILNRSMGKQDHFASAFGGLNKFTFMQNEETKIDKIDISPKNLDKLSSRLLLFYTGQTRDASHILETQVANSKTNLTDLSKMRDLCIPFEEILKNGELEKVGTLLHENWIYKKSLSVKISDTSIDDYYSQAIDAGALGGKILGAGGGGFLCFYVPEKDQNRVINSLPTLFSTKFELSDSGTTIILTDTS